MGSVHGVRHVKNYFWPRIGFESAQFTVIAAPERPSSVTLTSYSTLMTANSLWPWSFTYKPISFSSFSRRRSKAVWLWVFASHRRQRQCVRDSRHSGLRCPGNHPVWAFVSEDRHLVDWRADLRTFVGLQSVRKWRQAGDVPQHHAMQPNVPRRPVRGHIWRRHRIHEVHNAT